MQLIFKPIFNCHNIYWSTSLPRSRSLRLISPRVHEPCGTTDINGNVNEFDQYFRNRSIVLSFRYTFSKGQKVEIKNRTGAEEVDRT
jgi:hypothetical protein